MPSPASFAVSNRAALLATFAGLACAPCALAQLGSSINSDLRPLVDVQFPNAPAAAARPLHFLGLFDTGAPDSYVSPQVNTLLTLGSVPAQGAGNPALPTVSQDYNFTVGGFLGRRLAGPQVNNGASVTHQFTSGTAGAGALGTTRSMRVNLTDYNGVVNLINIGQNFVTNNPGAPPAGGLVTMVDPVHAFAAPINFSASDPAAGLNVFLTPRTRRTSSIGFLTLNSAQTPTPAINDNPGYLTVMNFVAPPAGAYVNSQNPVGRGPHNAPDPSMPLSAAQIAFINLTLGRGGPGQPPALTFIDPTTLAQYASIVPDTVAPTTGSLVNANQVLIGTDFLNRFTQFWNYSGPAPGIMLFGPTRQGDRDLVNRGLLMTVQRGASGGFLSGVEQMRLAGPPASMRVNTTISPAADELADQIGVGIYRSHASASNAVYISGREAMGLAAGGANIDQIDGMKLGADFLAPSVTVSPLQPDRFNSMVHFSVSADSQGLAEGNGNQTVGGGVRSQFDRGQVAGDIFYSTTARPRNRINQNTPENGSNNLRFNQDVLGLQGNAGPLVNAAGRGTHDNLRDFDLRPELGMVDSSESLRNVDPTIRQVGDNRNPMGVAETGALPVRSDRFQTNFYTYYSLTSNSATVVTQNTSGASIYTTSNAGTPSVWSTPQLMGLLNGDDIDAFSLQRVFDPGLGITPSGVAPVPGTVATQGGLLVDGRFDTNPFENFGRIDFTFNNDLIVFSLAPGSPTLALMSGFLQRALSPADLFISDFDGTFAIWASAESLGLRPQDNLDGLDITAIPAPGVLPLLALAGFAATRRRRGATL